VPSSAKAALASKLAVPQQAPLTAKAPTTWTATHRFDGGSWPGVAVLVSLGIP